MYCSKECKEKDWDLHQMNCGKSGEKDFDWEIKRCQYVTKGLGVFALRDIKKYEKISVERVLYSTTANFTENELINKLKGL